MSGSINVLSIVLAAVFVGCTTASQSTGDGDDGSDSVRMTAAESTVQTPMVVRGTAETVVAAVSKRSYAPGSVIGSVGCDDGMVTLDKGTMDGIVVDQMVLVCVREQHRLVTIGKAEALPAERRSVLKLGIRNVEDEDGDLIVVEDSRAANDFRSDPAKFIAEHEVFAVAVKTKAVLKEGMLK